MNTKPQGVVLVHGLALRGWAMLFLAWSLRRAGYRTLVPNYPSRKFTLEELAGDLIDQVSAFTRECSQVHFVGHSMGGLMIRLILRSGVVTDRGRIVMLGTPHRGSEIVDKLKDVFIFRRFFGPAGCSLTTDQRFDEALNLSGYEIGIIAGDLNVSMLAKYCDMPSPSEGRVTVHSSHAIDETDHIVLPVGHTLMLASPTVRDQCLYFLKSGRFAK